MNAHYTNSAYTHYISNTVTLDVTQQKPALIVGSLANVLTMQVTSLSNLCRKNARLSLFYKGLHGLAAIPENELQRPFLQGVLDTVELIHLLLCHLASMPINSHFSQGQ